MGAWQPLPDGLPPEVRHFVEQLRLLKDRTGLEGMLQPYADPYSAQASTEDEDAPADPGMAQTAVMQRAVEPLGERRAGRYLRKFYPWYVERIGGTKALQVVIEDALGLILRQAKDKWIGAV